MGPGPMTNNMFKDLSAWFSDSVQEERKSQWKQHGGVEAGFDAAQFIFSEDADCTDTKRIYKSQAYRNEHLAIFHAKYITDSLKVPNQKIGQYFLPPTEIQNLVRKQMKYIWDDECGSSNTNKVNQSKKNSTGNYERAGRLSTQSNEDLANNSNVSNAGGIGIQRQGTRQVSPQKDRLQSSSTKLYNHSAKESSQKRSLRSPRGKKRNNLNASSCSYHLRERSPVNYSEMPNIDVNDIELDCKEKPSTVTSPKNSDQDRSSKENPCAATSPRNSRQGRSSKENPGTATSPRNSKQSRSANLLNVLNEQDCMYFNIDELPKITSELEDLVPGKNGFEVMAKS